MAETSPNYNVTQAQIDGAMTKGSTATLNNTAHTISVDLTGATNGPVVITVDPDITLVP